MHLHASAPGDTKGRPVLLMLHGFGGSQHGCGIELLAAPPTQRRVARATVRGHSIGRRIAWRFAAALRAFPGAAP